VPDGITCYFPIVEPKDSCQGLALKWGIQDQHKQACFPQKGIWLQQTFIDRGSCCQP
jgi:hypothetical protein